nr:MAG TPA: Rubredoxin loop, ELECTRON TRANSPORT [Caudoviricetes sp.]
MASYKCQKCGKVLDEGQFYTYKNGSKTELCKKCLTMHIDNFDKSTYLWLLEKMDVPYVPAEWNSLRDKAYAKDAEKMNGMSVFGKYLSKMKLKQWKEYSWADSEKLQAEAAAKAENNGVEKNEEFEAELQAKYEAGEISEAEYKTLMSVPAQMKAEEDRPAANPYLGPDNPYNEQEMFPEEELPDPSAELTQEDKIYLAMKWGRMYKLAEWVELEKTYNEMMDSFDIQDADTKNTLILLCKTTLKANQALDSGDIEGFQKLSKVQESLRKSAKFTAAQNKEKKDDFIDCVGELVLMCEKEGFIPRYATNIPQDKVDITLRDMQNYTRKLVTQDLGFGQQIEDALKKIQLQKELDAQADADEPEKLSTEDYENYFNEIEEQKDKDVATLNEEGDE